MPADASEFALGRGRLLRRRQPFDQSDRRHLRIGDDSHAADAGNIRRRKMNRAAELTHARDGGVHVVDGDIPNPALRPAASPDLFRQVHHAAHRRLADPEKRVGVARRRGVLRAPAHDVRVEGPGGLHVGREQLVPAKPTMGFGHVSISLASARTVAQRPKTSSAGRMIERAIHSLHSGLIYRHGSGKNPDLPRRGANSEDGMLHEEKGHASSSTDSARRPRSAHALFCEFEAESFANFLQALSS